MLQTWIVLFVLGVLVARVPATVACDGCLLQLTLWVGWPALLTSLIVALGAGWLSRRRRRLVVIGVLAFVWGLGHAAPFPSDDGTPRSDEDPAEVIKVTSADTVSGPVLVRVGETVYEVSGVQTVGALGRVAGLPAVRLYGSTRGIFKVLPESRSSATEAGFLAKTRDTVRAIAAARGKALSPFYRAWLAGLVMGERTALPVDVRDAFKRTGLYHLLVVSGLHVSLMALLMAAVLRAPAHLAYTLLLISPRVWRHTAAVLQVLAGVAALLYLAVTGSPAAAQRAALLFVVQEVAAVFYGSLPLCDRLRLAAAAQILIFPVGFVGEATLMSWTAYLLVLRRDDVSPLATASTSRLRRLVPYALRVQVGLTALVAAVFGQLALVGLAANLVLIPAFPVLLLTGLAALLVPELPLLPLLLAIQRSFIAAVRLFDGLCDWAPWLSVAGEDLPTLVRAGCLGLSAWILLNTCRDLSIRT